MQIREVARVRKENYRAPVSNKQLLSMCSNHCKRHIYAKKIMSASWSG